MHPVGFEPTHLSIAVLETAPLDHSGTNASISIFETSLFTSSPFLFFFFSSSRFFLFSFLDDFFYRTKMHPVGFEPTHLSIAELKSAPLDHSGTNAFYIFSFVFLLSYSFFFFLFFFLLSFFFHSKNGDEGYRSPCPSHAKRMLYHLSYIPSLYISSLFLSFYPLFFFL